MHDEYVKYLNQTIKDSEEKDFDKMIKIMNKAIENLPKKCKEIFLLSKKRAIQILKYQKYCLYL